MTIQDKIKELSDKITKANEAYYRFDEPIMSDAEYNEYIENALDEADREAEDPNTKYYTHEEMKKMARRIIDGE